MPGKEMTHVLAKSKVQIAVTVLLTLAFLGSGIMKLTGAEDIRQGFEHWGYPVFFMYIIGLCEVAGAVGLWLGRFSYAAKVCLIILMAGARCNSPRLRHVHGGRAAHHPDPPYRGDAGAAPQRTRYPAAT